MKKIFLIAIVTVLISACIPKKHYSAQEEKQRLEYAQQIMNNDTEYKKSNNKFKKLMFELQRDKKFLDSMPPYIKKSPQATSCVSEVFTKKLQEAAEASSSMVRLNSLINEFETEELAQMAAYSNQGKIHLLPNLQARYQKALEKQTAELDSAEGAKRLEGLALTFIEQSVSEFQRCIDMVSNTRKPNKSKFQEGLY